MLAELQDFKLNTISYQNSYMLYIMITCNMLDFSSATAPCIKMTLDG